MMVRLMMVDGDDEDYDDGGCDKESTKANQ